MILWGFCVLVRFLVKSQQATLLHEYVSFLFAFWLFSSLLASKGMGRRAGVKGNKLVEKEDESRANALKAERGEKNEGREREEKNGRKEIVLHVFVVASPRKVKGFVWLLRVWERGDGCMISRYK
jgi:hypothetical protein